MDHTIIADSADEQPEELLAWHKPEVLEIHVSTDTAAGGGSNIDSLGGTLFESDMRLKEGVSGIGDALAGILSLRGVTYRYNTTDYPELGLSDGPQIGFLAQELEKVYPQLVVTRKDGFKAVNYALLVPVLVEAIKQQQSMIVELQTQVDELRQKSS